MNQILKVIFVVFFFCVLLAITPTHSHALIVLAPIVLIPIIKLIALIIAGLTLPATTAGIIYSKLTKHNTTKVVVIVVGFLALTAIILGVILKIINPERPIF